MSTFLFKKFSVTNVASAMKVNTDGVLLGAAMSLPEECRRALDIGTGTGTIALMAAQRLSDRGTDFRIEAIDIDAPSADEAAANFAASPWKDRLSVSHVALEDYAPEGDFDLVFSNPPYFDASLQNPDARKSEARHSLSMSYREILRFAADRLSENGLLAMVLPSECEAALLREARSRNLHLRRILRIRTTPKKQPRRIIAEFGPGRCDSPVEETLTLQDPANCSGNKENRTMEYIALTKEFYLD